MKASFNIDIDDGNKDKLCEHGLTVDEIIKFFNTEPSYRKDEEHSKNEDRYLAFGPLGDRFIYVAFTFRVKRGKLHYRPISARYARPKEIRRLYEQIKQSE